MAAGVGLLVRGRGTAVEEEREIRGGERRKETGTWNRRFSAELLAFNLTANPPRQPHIYKQMGKPNYSRNWGSATAIFQQAFSRLYG